MLYVSSFKERVMVSGLGVRSQLGSKQTHQNAEIFGAINSTVLYIMKI